MDYLIKKNSTTFLKTFAILIIINSHLDEVYGNSLFASGGAIGNTLFFLLSGYGLKFSYDRNPLPFKKWVFKRLKGIFTSVWFLNILLVLLSLFNLHDISNFYNFFISFIITDYWFINAIIIYYLIGYPFLRLPLKNFLQILALILFLYFIIYFMFFDVYNAFVVELMPYKMFFYFVVFLCGILIKIFGEDLIISRSLNIILLTILIVIYCLIKVFYKETILFEELQFLQLFIQLLIGYFMICLNFEFASINFQKKFKYLSYLNAIISNVTLEIYLIHGFIVSYFVKIDMPTHFKLILIFIVSIILSVFFKIVTKYLASLK